MEELRSEEMMDAVATVAEEVTENVVTKCGLSLGQKFVVGGTVVAVVAGAVYGICKFVGKKKAKKDEEVAEAVEAVDESNFDEKTE